MQSKKWAMGFGTLAGTLRIVNAENKFRILMMVTVLVA